MVPPSVMAGLGLFVGCGIHRPAPNIPDTAVGRPARLGSPAAVGPADVRLGPLPSGATVRLDVVLRPRDPTGLLRFAAAVSTPGNALYRHYLGRGQLGVEFGATHRAINKVTATLRAEGLSVGRVSADELSIPVEGTAAQVSAAFSTSLERYRLPNGRVAYVNTAAPLLTGSELPYVTAVVGLSTLDQPAAVGLAAAGRGVRVDSQPKVLTGGAQPCRSAVSAASNLGVYTADEVASAYGFSGLYGLGDEGSGTTVAFFELAPNLQSDISAYQKCYGTSASVSYVKVDGGSGAGAGQGEADLDIENVIGLAPDARIEVYQGPDSDVGSLDTYRQIVDDDSAHVISTSWGYCETQADSVRPENTLFEMAAAQGQSVLAAAGDLGSEGCGPGTLAVDDPASQPFVTGVGGTTLTTIDQPPLQSVWNRDGAGAGGGGVSALWSMPAYQTLAQHLGVIDGYSSGAPCKAPKGRYCREVPDVSADADPSTGYLVYDDGSWKTFAGTSGAAPLWAALLALVDSSPDCHGEPPVGFANPVLYRAAANSYASDFGDITTGDNDLTGTNSGLYPALAGYDMASGLGSPVAFSLARSLCDGASPSAVTVTSPGSQISRQGSAVDLSITASDSSDEPVTYSAVGLPAGLSISSSGDIEGVPTTVASCAVTVLATDPSGATGSVDFDWSVVSLDANIVIVTDPGPITSERGTNVKLTISATDSGHRALTYAAVGLPGSLQLDPASGEVNGTVTARSGEYQVELAARDSTGASGSAYFLWTVTAPDHVVVTDPGRQQSDAGSSVRLRVLATDTAGLEPDFLATGLPKGLTISPSGVVTGIARGVGTSTVIVRATDPSGANGSAEFSWRIYSITFSPRSLPAATARSAYSVRLSARGGTAPYVWRLRVGTLPPGLSLASTGRISGRPEKAGLWRFTIDVTDHSRPAFSATKRWSISVGRASPGSP